MIVVPQLVLDRETGKICIMIKIGSDVVVRDLPDNLATATKEELQEYMGTVVPQMIDGLRAEIQKKRRTIWKKWKKANDA